MTHRTRLTVWTSLALVVSTLALAAPATSAPSKADLRRAKVKVADFEKKMELLVERYNQTRLSLDEIDALLGRLRLSQKRARTRQADAQQRLNRVAAGAYRDGSYGIVQLLNSPSMSVLSDRLEMLDLMARIQVDSATTAQVAGVQARELGDDLKTAEVRQRVVLRTLGKQKGTIKERIADQRALVESLEEKLRRPVVVKAPAPQRRSGPAPKINGEGAAAAISAARSAIGVRYTYAGDNPDQGFDCSGLTMWAWRYGGVSLPHSSQAQYDQYPHVERSELQPGDLLMFYKPISHVGLYIGGGQMIHASSSNDAVVQQAVYWEHFTGAARVT